MWENSSPYRPIGLSPGKDGQLLSINVSVLDLALSLLLVLCVCVCAGVGSGVCVQHKETAVNLITLYSAPKSERGQGGVNKLLSRGSPELTPGVQDLCHQADAFILIVDSTSKHTGKLVRHTNVCIVLIC